MNKRLRKKKHLGEFKEWIADVEVVLAPDADFDSFLDRFIEDCVEAGGMYFGGGGRHPRLEGVVELGRNELYQQRHGWVMRWLEDRAEVTRFTVGEPVDAWYA